MSKSAWHENRIALVGGQSARFPQTQVQHWISLTRAAEQIRQLLRDVDAKMSAIEDDPGLNPDGIRQRCAEVASPAIAALDALVAPAESQAARRIAALKDKATTSIAAPGNESVASDIRRHIAASKSPALTAFNLKDDPATISAILSAPAYLSGLTSEQAETLRTKVIGTTPHQKEIGEIESALEVIRGAIRSATAMINQRAQLSTAATIEELRAKAAQNA